MTDAAGVLDIVDDAQAFVPADALQPLSDATLRQLGLQELSDALDAVQKAGADDAGKTLRGVAENIGSMIAKQALNAGFAKAALEGAARDAGLIGAVGLKTVRNTIAAGIKAGSRVDQGTARRAAPARQRRPRPAAVHNSSLAASVPSSAAAAPAPPIGANDFATSQTGGSPDASAVAGGVGGNVPPPDAPDDEDGLNMRLAFYPLTDLGNAERFRDRYKNRLMWCTALGWLAWDGRRWSRDGAEELVKIAEHDTVRAIQREAKTLADSERDFIVGGSEKEPVFYSDKIAKWGRSSEASNKLGALSKRGSPYFAIAIDRLDADKMKINVANGTLVVARKGAGGGDYVNFRPHDPADLITKLAPVIYDPDADAPEYDKFLARVQPSVEMRTFLHQWLGLSLTGDVSEQKLAFLYGKGGNGKSVLIDAVSYVAGDYGETVPIETFLDHGKARGAGQATPDLAILPGVRMLRTSEPEKNSKLAEAMIKLVTGGEPIQARHLNRDFFKFYPQFKLTMSGNYRPTIAGTDEGIWRRVRLVPFNISIPKDERDIHLHDKLRAEASGILNRLLDGLRHWCDTGLLEPEDVTTATAEYRSASDPLGRFLSTCVEASEGDRVQSSVLHQVYEAWCKSSGESAWKNRGFSMVMDERGYKRKQSDVVWWLDIKLIRQASDFVDINGNPIRVSDTGPSANQQEAGDMAF